MTKRINEPKNITIETSRILTSREFKENLRKRMIITKSERARDRDTYVSKPNGFTKVDQWVE